MAACKGRLFGPGLAPTGVEVEVVLANAVLTVQASGERPWRVAASQLSLRHTGFNASQFELAWRDGTGAWACHMSEPAAIAALLAHWPAELAPATKALARARRRALLPWTALVMVIALPTLLVAMLLFSQERVVDFIAARISLSVERQIGVAAMTQVRAATELLTEGDQWQALNAVAVGVVGANNNAYRFHLAADDGVNAFALPGGDIVVNRGLLTAARTPGELAGVLAHEIQHVALRHSLKGMIRAAGVSMAWSLILGDPGATLAGQAAERLLSLKFSRDAEREADAGGFMLLVERGIDPRGMVDFFATLAKQSEATPPALLASHPASAEREAALSARLAKLAPGCCRVLTVAVPWPSLE